MHRLGYLIAGARPVSPHLIHAVINDATVEALDLDAQNKNLYTRVLPLLGDAGIKDIGCDVFFTERALSLEEPMLSSIISKDLRVHFPVIIASGTSRPSDAAEQEKWDKFLWRPRIIKPGSPPVAGHVLFPAGMLAPVTSGLGHINCHVDRDGTIRRLALLYQFEDGFWPAISLELLCKYLDVDPGLIEVSFGSHLLIPGTGKNPAIRIPIDESGMMRLSYAGPWKDSFVHFPVHRLLEAENDPDAQVRLYDDLSEALTFLSDSSTRRKDYGVIPLESAYPLSGIHLNALNGMLQGTFPARVSIPEYFIILFASCLGLWLSIRIFDTYTAALLAGAGLILLSLVYFFARYFTAYVIPLPTAPLSGICFSLIALGVYYYAQNRRYTAVLREKASSAQSLELLNRELEDSNRAYIHLERNITRLMRSLTDKTRIPLSRLHEVLEAFRVHEKTLPAEVVKELRRADETTRSLSALIRELSEITDVKLGFDHLESKEIDLARCAKGIVSRLLPLAESRGSNLVFRDADASIGIAANERMLEKMLFLLVTAVLKSSSPGSIVRVSCYGKKTSCGMRIEIQGEKESDLASLLLPSGSNSSDNNRAGYAAHRNSMLYDYIALHNGKVSIESGSPGIEIVDVIFPVGLPSSGDQIPDEPKINREIEKTKDAEKPLQKNQDVQKPVFPRNPVIIIEPDAAALNEYKETLASGGITNIVLSNEASDTGKSIEAKKGSAIIMDLAMPDISGLALLAGLREAHPEIPVIVVSEIDAVETAVECMKQGAFDFAVKPVSAARLCTLIRRAVERSEIESEAKRLREDKRKALHHPEAFVSIVTCDPDMMDLFKTMEAFAAGSEPVLVLGESGTGKELFAEALHLLSGRSGALVKENIGALDPGIFSDTLFGHTKGAYTGAHAVRNGLVEEALGGTIFLDEIGELDAEIQVKLLRFIESGEYRPVGSDRPRVSDARIVAATNADIDSLVRAGRFRRDLYYRLSHVIRIPPLRMRIGDIEVLTEYFLMNAAAKFNKDAFVVSKRLLGRMKQYTFPGNVREIENLVFAAAKLSDNGKEAEAYITQYLESRGAMEFSRQKTDSQAPGASFPTLEEAEDRLINEAMLRTGNNQRAAARLLGISPFALNRRLQRKRSD